MPNSLRVKLSKLRYKGNITNDEYQELIKKLDGHDKQIRTDAIDEFVKAFKDNMLKSTTPTWMCYVDEIAEKLKEQK